jgi:hypothetical protein
MATVRPLVTVSCSGSFRHTDPDLYSLQKLESGPLFRFISHIRADPGVDVKKEYPVVQCMSSNMTLRIKFEGLHDNLVYNLVAAKVEEMIKVQRASIDAQDDT